MLCEVCRERLVLAIAFSFHVDGYFIGNVITLLRLKGRLES